MLNLIAQSANFFVSMLVVASVVLSFFNNRKKANKSELDDRFVELSKRLDEQKDVSKRLQLQIDEKNKQIHDLQQQNAQEEAILQNRSPELEQTLALLASGQARILEILAGANIEIGGTNETK